MNSYKDFYLLKLKGIDTLGEAEDLEGTEIFVPEEDLQSLENDSYYHFQLVGCTVFTRACDVVGTVKDILGVRNNNLLVVEKGSKEILIPFVRDICVKVDPESRKIIVDPPEGLLDLNEI